MKEVNTTVLIERLAEGWASSHAGLANEFLQRWAAALCTEADVGEVGENTAEFRLTLSDIRLRTMHEVPCLLISGDGNDTEPLIKFWNRFNTPKHLPFVLTLSEATYSSATRALRSRRCVILAANEIRQMLAADLPLVRLKHILIEQIPKRTLIPYNLLIPAEGGMFFGREHELSRLRDEDSTSFAVAGPGRIGKTSLTLRYKNEMVRTRDPRAASILYVSLYSTEHLPDRTARFLAMKIENSRRSDRITAKDLTNFLLYRQRRYGGLLELLLDEVDEDCEGEAFKALGEAARAGLCRLVLCGKGGLLKMMLSSKSPLDCRLDLLQLESLDDNSTRDLLIKPLTDLGFTVEKPDILLDEVIKLTGRLPSLVQLFGMKLADRAILQQTDTVALEHLDALKRDFFIAQFYIKSINELQDSRARAVALHLLNASSQEFSIPEVQAIARNGGLYLDIKTTNDICIDLLINNVLVWANGSYRVANGGLKFYAAKNYYLQGAPGGSSPDAHAARALES